MSKSYTRYLADPSGAGFKIFQNPVMCFDRKESDTPYFKVKIKVLYHEKSFKGGRPTPSFFKRFFRALEAAAITFKNNLKVI